MAVEGSTMFLDSIPTLAQASCFFFVYICDAGSSPTSTIATQGFLGSSATLAFAFSRRASAIFFPSIIFPVISPLQPSSG